MPQYNASRPRVAVIGCGFIFRSVYRPILRAAEDRVYVAAVCDVRPEVAQEAAEAFTDARAYSSIEALIEREALDAVLVLAPELQNAAVATIALGHDLAVYLEKPPSVSVRELDELMTQESRSAGYVYAAFNRRHTPFEDLRLPANIREIRGMLSRRQRLLKTFPYTAIHLVDSAAYFSRCTFADVRAVIQPGPERWVITGQMTNGVSCELVCVPDGADHVEYLVFVGDTTREFHFPNPETSSAQSENSRLEATGFTRCFESFLRLLASGDRDNSPHRLSSCRSAIGVMEQMLAEA